jgi:hypothetical protein
MVENTCFDAGAFGEAVFIFCFSISSILVLGITINARSVLCAAETFLMSVLIPVFFKMHFTTN